MRIGTVCFCSRQGIGWLPKWFYDAGVITDPILYRHSRHNHTEWYPPETPILATRDLVSAPEVEEMIRRVDALLFFETPFDWRIIARAKELKKRTYIVPMYECTPRHIPLQPHKWLCPSLLDCDYFPGHPFIQIPVPDDIVWNERQVARHFLHEGGNLGLRGHKGTLEILKAFDLVTKPIHLTVRAQDIRGLEEKAKNAGKTWTDGGSSIHIHSNDKVLEIRKDVCPRDMLYSTSHDVFIMAEKYNGLSLPLLEAWASGMCVMTSSRFPMPTWLPNKPLIPVHSYSKQCISGAYMEYDEAEVRPEDIAAKLDEMYDTDISGYSYQGRTFREQNSWTRLKPVWMEALSS